MPDCTFVSMEIVSCCWGIWNFVFFVGLLVSIFSKEDVVFFTFPRPLATIMCIICLLMFNLTMYYSQTTPDQCSNIMNVGN